MGGSTTADTPVSVLNPANAVTASRFLVLPPFAYAVDHDLNQVALALVFVCALLDKFDGVAARLFDCRSAFGEVFDAIADGICYGFLIGWMAYRGWVPWEPVAVIFALGVINSVFRAVYARRAGRATNYQSFAMERMTVLTAYLGGLGCAGYQVPFFYWCCTLLMLTVVVHDAKRMLWDPIPS